MSSYPGLDPGFKQGQSKLQMLKVDGGIDSAATIRVLLRHRRFICGDVRVLRAAAAALFYNHVPDRLHVQAEVVVHEVVLKMFRKPAMDLHGIWASADWASSERL